MLSLPRLSLYIHIPWCKIKCPYCDFNAYEIREKIQYRNYLKTLILDLKSHFRYLQGRTFSSVSIGGGTPSIVPSDMLEILMNFLISNDLVTQKVEVTIETNPDISTQCSIEKYKNIGINRISLGVQSFQEEKLTLLGRTHNNNHTTKAIRNIKRAGVKNFNIDILYGLPKQTYKDAMYDLKEAIKFSPTHISWYQLTVKQKSALFKYLPNEEIIYFIENMGKSILEKNGYLHYELSSFAINEKYQGQHNVNYWKFGDYIGIGAGAHSKVTDIKKKLIKRYEKTKNPSLYILKKDFSTNQRTVKRSEIIYEFMMNYLSLTSGFTESVFEARTGIEIKKIIKKLHFAINLGLICKEEEKYIPTNLGKQFLNDLINIFA